MHKLQLSCRFETLTFLPYIYSNFLELLIKHYVMVVNDSLMKVTMKHTYVYVLVCWSLCHIFTPGLSELSERTVSVLKVFVLVHVSTDELTDL